MFIDRLHGDLVVPSVGADEFHPCNPGAALYFNNRVELAPVSLLQLSLGFVTDVHQIFQHRWAARFQSS